MLGEEDLPLTFRSEILGSIMPALRAGECCSLLGITGVGKSNIANFIARTDVQKEYWKDDRTWVVLIDSDGLIFDNQPEEYVVFEYIIHQIIMTAESERHSSDFAGWASTLHAQLVKEPNGHLAFRFLERISAQLCREQHVQLVLAFDQFEDIWSTFPPRFFLNLRHLRDKLKYWLVFLTITRRRLTDLRSDSLSVEAFSELMSPHVYGIGMYSKPDAVMMIERLSQRRAITIQEDLRENMLELSGQHPALLRAVFWSIIETPQGSYSVHDLLGRGSITEECIKIWNDLTPAEQAITRLLADRVPLVQPDPAVLADLHLQGLVCGEPPSLFSPLFAAWVRTQAFDNSAGIRVDRLRRRVWVDEQELRQPLSPREFDLLLYLAEHVGTVCGREDLLRMLYKDEQIYDINDDRLDTVLRRLRVALGENKRPTRYLVTHRGVGIMLTRGQVSE